MRRIEIDDDLYAVLEANVKGFERPNDVLRRLLLGESEAKAMPSSPPGALARLIEKGLVKAGDTLSHNQVRKGRSFVGTVEPDGWIRTSVKRYRDPSPALGGLVGTSIDGWKHWTHDASSKTLRQLRGEVGGTGRSAQ